VCVFFRPAVCYLRKKVIFGILVVKSLSLKIFMHRIFVFALIALIDYALIKRRIISLYYFHPVGRNRLSSWWNTYSVYGKSSGLSDSFPACGKVRVPLGNLVCQIVNF